MLTHSAPAADKVLDLLEIASREPGLSLASLAERSGMPKSTCFRLLTTLQERGYLCRPKRGAYLPGPALARLARDCDERECIADWCRKHIAALARDLKATAHLGMLEGDMATYLVKHRSGRLKVRSFEHTQLEAYCSGMGKVLLASLEPGELEDYLGQGDFVALTEMTITDPEVLRREVQQVREQGWATDDGEIYPEIACIAVPVQDRSGKTVAAISVSFNRKDHPASSLIAHIPALRLTASKVSPAFL